MFEVKLSRPIFERSLLETKKHETIVCKDPMIKDFFGLDFSAANSHESAVTLLSRLSGVDKACLSTMDISDFIKISEKLAKVMGQTK